MLQLRVHVHVSTIMQYLCIVHVHVHMYMYTHTYALCGYTRHLRTCRYVAIHVNRPSGISEAAAISVNRTQAHDALAYLACWTLNLSQSEY